LITDSIGGTELKDKIQDIDKFEADLSKTENDLNQMPYSQLAKEVDQQQE